MSNEKIISLLYVGLNTIHEENMAIANLIATGYGKDSEKVVKKWADEVDASFKRVMHEITDEMNINEVDDGK